MKDLLRLIISLALIGTSMLKIGAQPLDISFVSDNLDISGTLSIPEGVGPFPVVIFVHGSGPCDRNQTITLADGNSKCLYPKLFGKTIRVFEDISDYLVLNGVATLRWDKRTFTYANVLEPSKVSINDFVKDVHKAIEFVMQRSEIDSNYIFLMGHSQGANLIPEVAKNNSVAGLISLASPSTTIDILLSNQFKNLYKYCLNDTLGGNFIAEQISTQFQKVRSGSISDEQQIEILFPGAAEPIPFGYTKFWKEWLYMSDNIIKNYLENKIPMLFIQGKDDFNVPFEDALKFEENLPSKFTTICILDNLNHMLTNSEIPKVSDLVLRKIHSWITSVSLLKYNNSINDKMKTFFIYKSASQLIIHGDVLLSAKEIYITDNDDKLIKHQEINLITDDIKIDADLKKGFYKVHLKLWNENLISRKIFL